MIEELIIGTDCAGLGSLEEATQRLQVKHRIAFACEKDKHAKASYLANHHAEYFYDDITTRNNEQAPGCDFYFAGFPCQTFSMAGNRKGFEDTRGTIFYNCLDYVKVHKPRIIGFENVKGLLSHDKKKGTNGKYGNTFNTILECLAASINGQRNIYKYEDCIDYHIHFFVMNTKKFGIPQNRERVFIIGFRDEQDSINFTRPKEFGLKLRLKDLLEDNVDEKYYLSDKALEYLFRAVHERNKENFKIDDGSGVCSDSTANLHKGVHNGGETYIAEPEPQIISLRGRHLVNGKRVDVAGQGHEQVPTFNTDGIANTVTSVQKDNLLVLFDAYTTEVRQLNPSKESHNQQPYMQNRVYDAEAISPAITQYSRQLNVFVNDNNVSHKPFVFLLELVNDFFTFENEKTKGNADTILRTLFQTINPASVYEWCIDVCTYFQEDEILQPRVHEEGIFHKGQETTGQHNYRCKQKESERFGDKWLLLNLWKKECKRCSSHRQKSIKQLIRELAKVVSIMPYKNTSTEKNMFCNWLLKSTQGQKLLRQAFTTIQKIQNPIRIQGKPTLENHNGFRIRRLTELEVFRLMGYSDEFFYRCKTVNSSTQLYRQAGNSIVVNTIMHLLIQIFKAIKIPYTYEQP